MASNMSNMWKELQSRHIYLEQSIASIDDSHAATQSIPKQAPHKGATREVPADNIYSRGVSWTEQKKKHISDRREELDSREVEECSFTPSIGPALKSVVVKSEDIVNRLFKASQDRRRSAQDVAALKVDEEFRQTHTFQPAMVTDNAAVAPKFMTDPDRRVDRRAAMVRSPGLECTFSPAIRPHTPTTDTLQMYLATPAHDRLSRPKKSTPAEELSPPPKRPASAVDGAFNGFLQRNERAQRRKQNKIAQMDRRVTSQLTFRPDICPRSAEIAPTTPFIERSHSTLARRAVRQKRKEIKDALPAPAAPAINARSRSLRARSVDELSRGDAQKAAVARERVRRQQESRALEGATFRPQLVSAQLQGRSEGIVNRTARDQRRKAREVRRAQAEEAVREMDGCTFRPKTIACPQFVKTIAGGLVGVRPEENG